MLRNTVAPAPVGMGRRLRLIVWVFVAVVMGLMCQGRIEFESIALAHLVDFRKVFATELLALAPLQAQGLVRVEADAIEVTPLGWYVVRAVAMVFDRHLQADRARSHYANLI